MAGWISVHRNIFDHWLWTDKPFARGQAWIDLILLANHEDKKVFHDGKLLEVKRGERVTSKRKLSERWGWSINKVTKFLDMLVEEEMIAYKSDSKKTV